MRRRIPLLFGLAGLSLAGCINGSTARESAESSRLAGIAHRQDYDRYVTSRSESLMRSGAIPDRLEAEQKARDEATRRYGAPAGSSATYTFGSYKKTRAQSELNTSLTKIERDRRER